MNANANAPNSWQVGTVTTDSAENAFWSDKLKAQAPPTGPSRFTDFRWYAVRTGIVVADSDGFDREYLIPRLVVEELLKTWPPFYTVPGDGCVIFRAIGSSLEARVRAFFHVIEPAYSAMPRFFRFNCKNRRRRVPPNNKDKTSPLFESADK